MYLALKNLKITSEKGQQWSEREKKSTNDFPGG